MKRMFQIGLLSALLAVGSTANNVARAAGDNALATAEAAAIANTAGNAYDFAKGDGAAPENAVPENADIEAMSAENAERVASGDCPAREAERFGDFELAECAPSGAEQNDAWTKAEPPAAENANAVRQANDEAIRDAVQQAYGAGMCPA